MTGQQGNITCIIGLGNPGVQYQATRHNIGFMVIDALCAAHGGTWKPTPIAQEAKITLGNNTVLLIKPQTYMNSSGRIVPVLKKRGITPDNMLVIHDELELPFGVVKYRFGGSHRGHNGLRSLIDAGGPEFGRVRCGIGRPEHKNEVPEYVLRPFNQDVQDVQKMIEAAVAEIEQATKI